MSSFKISEANVTLKSSRFNVFGLDVSLEVTRSQTRMTTNSAEIGRGHGT